MKRGRTVSGRMSMRQTRTWVDEPADVPYKFYTDVVARLLDSSGIMHMVVPAPENSSHRRQTVCTSDRWSTVEPVTIVWDPLEMVTCLACLGGYRGG